MVQHTLKQQLVNRVSTWCGVTVDQQENSATTIYFNSTPLARFPTDDSIEACLCGSMRDRIVNEGFELPDGLWLTNTDHHLIVDLRLPGGMEEAVRVILNAYIFAQSQQVDECGLDENVLKNDPSCKQVNDEIKQHRLRLAERYAEYPAV